MSRTSWNTFADRMESIARRFHKTIWKWPEVSSTHGQCDEVPLSSMWSPHIHRRHWTTKKTKTNGNYQTFGRVYRIVSEFFVIIADSIPIHSNLWALVHLIEIDWHAMEIVYFRLKCNMRFDMQRPFNRIKMNENRWEMKCCCSCCCWVNEVAEMTSMAYLLYRTMSGSQMCSDGTYSSVTPPYSDGSHFNL